jgi:hypothetical protein
LKTKNKNEAFLTINPWILEKMRKFAC